MGARRAARVTLVAGVAVLGMAVVWWQMEGGGVAVSPDVALKPGATATAANSGGKIAKDLELELYRQLRDGDAVQKQQATKTLADLVASQPYQMVEDLPKWLKPLMEARLYVQVLELTEKAIPLHAQNSAAVSDQQRARAEALLALGEHERALAEAKSAFNVSTQKAVDRTFVLLVEALKATRQATDPGIIERLERQQVAGARFLEADERNVLQSVEVSAVRYASGLERLSGAKSYDEFMAKGNLLLIADRATEAREAFRQAARLPDVKGKKLFAALEGIVCAKRAEHSSIGYGNAIVEAMKYGATGSPELAMLVDLNLPIRQLYDAGRFIPPARLPQSTTMSAEAGVRPDLSSRLQQPITVVANAMPSDPDLLAWLRRLQGNLAAASDTLAELQAILEKTPLETVTLLELGRDLHLATDDTQASARIFIVALRRLNEVVAQQGGAEEGLAAVRLLEQFRDDYTPVLWARAATDVDASKTLEAIYIDYLRWCPADDPQLSKQRPLIGLYLANLYLSQEKFDDQLATLASVKAFPMSPGLLRLLQHSEALGKYNLGMYSDAVPLLRLTASWEGFRGRREAHRHLILALKKLDLTAEAEAELSEYARLYSPPVSELRGLMADSGATSHNP